MKKRLPVLLAALIAVAAAVGTGALAGSSDTAGAKANLDSYRAVPTFKAPGPAFDGLLVAALVDRAKEGDGDSPRLFLR